MKTQIASNPISIQEMQDHTEENVFGESTMFTILLINTRLRRVERLGNSHDPYSIISMLDIFIKHPKTGKGFIPNPARSGWAPRTSYISENASAYIVSWDSRNRTPNYTEAMKLVKRPCEVITSMVKEVGVQYSATFSETTVNTSKKTPSAEEKLFKSALISMTVPAMA